MVKVKGKPSIPEGTTIRFLPETTAVETATQGHVTKVAQDTGKRAIRAGSLADVFQPKNFVLYLILLCLVVGLFYLFFRLRQNEQKTHLLYADSVNRLTDDDVHAIVDDHLKVALGPLVAEIRNLGVAIGTVRKQTSPSALLQSLVGVVGSEDEEGPTRAADVEDETPLAPEDEADEAALLFVRATHVHQPAFSGARSRDVAEQQIEEVFEEDHEPTAHIDDDDEPIKDGNRTAEENHPDEPIVSFTAVGATS